MKYEIGEIAEVINEYVAMVDSFKQFESAHETLDDSLTELHALCFSLLNRIVIMNEPTALKNEFFIA